jgi:hypothetical protein
MLIFFQVQGRTIFATCAGRGVIKIVFFYRGVQRQTISTASAGRGVIKIVFFYRFRDGRSLPPAPGGAAASHPEQPAPLSPVALAVAEDQVQIFL